MMRPFRHTVCLLLLFVLAACSKEEDPPKAQVSTAQIVLATDAGAAGTFTVTANTQWTLSCEGDALRVTPDRGGNGETTVTVTTSEANPTLRRRKVGRITLHCPAAATEYPLEVYQKPAVATQTVLLYMPGRDLLSFYCHNIEGVSAAVSDRIPGDGRMLVCFQPESQRKAVMQEIYYDALTNRCETGTLKSYDDFNAGSAEDVRRMLADAAELAPAQRYGLVIGCHGKAWIPARAGNITSYALRRDFAGHSEAEFWSPAPGAKQTRSFGDSGYELDIEVLAAVLESLPFRFDYLLFDDCFMANIETLYDLRRAVDYIIASPCEIMGAGFPYDRVMPHLFAEQGASHDLEKACWEFWNFYQNEWASLPGNEQSGCISMAVTAQLEALAEVMRRIKARGKQSFELTELQYYEGLRTHLFYDLGHYVALSCGDPALVDEFSAQLDLTFPAACRLNTPGFYSKYNDRLNPVHHYSGVSVSEPATRYAAENRLTNWYRDTHE